MVSCSSYDADTPAHQPESLADPEAGLAGSSFGWQAEVSAPLVDDVRGFSACAAAPVCLLDPGCLLG